MIVSYDMIIISSYTITKYRLINMLCSYFSFNDIFHLSCLFSGFHLKIFNTFVVFY